MISCFLMLRLPMTTTPMTPLINHVSNSLIGNWLSLTSHAGVYYPGAPTRVVGFMDTSPIARPIDAIPHFPTHDQSPGLQNRRPSGHGLGLLLPQHQEYSRSNISSSQPLDMKHSTVSHSPLPDQPIPNASINDMYVHSDYHSRVSLRFQQALHGPVWSLGEPRTRK